MVTKIFLLEKAFRFKDNPLLELCFKESEKYFLFARLEKQRPCKYFKGQTRSLSYLAFKEKSLFELQEKLLTRFKFKLEITSLSLLELVDKLSLPSDSRLCLVCDFPCLEDEEKK